MSLLFRISSLLSHGLQGHESLDLSDEDIAVVSVMGSVFFNQTENKNGRKRS
jgi:hypothetical protein